MNHITKAILAAFLILIPTADKSPSAEEKLKPEQLVEKHLASLGAPEARAAVKSRAVSGTVDVIFRLGSTGGAKGSSTILSEGKSTRFGLRFQSIEYPGEQWAYDGNKVSVGMVRPGERSNLSSFLYHYDVLMREGLLGGPLTTAWAMLDVAGRQAKLNYSGTKKLEGKPYHALQYRARKGSGDLSIHLYFEPETFRLVHSEYRLVQPSGMAKTPMDSSGQRDSIFTIHEHFQDYRTVDGLTLPHLYTIGFTIEGQSNTFMADWTITISEIAHNVTVDPKTFAVQ